MAKLVAFIDRDGKPIDAKKWRELRADPAYPIVRQYDNGVVNVTLQWVGRIEDPQNTFSDYWKVFILLVKNYTADGSLVVDPADSDATFPDEEKGVEAYEKFLESWTASKRDDEGVLVEEGNTLELPKGPDPNRPQTESEDIEGGAW
jgi:hypothetical protein